MTWPVDHASAAVDAVTDALEELARRPPVRAPPVRGARTFTAILPSGRVISLKADSALALVAETNHLAKAIGRLGEQRRIALGANRWALRSLSRKVLADFERSSKRTQRSARKLGSWLLSADARLSRRISQAAKQQRSLARRQLTWIRRLSWRELWDQLILASSIPLFVAYGQSGRPLGANNAGLLLSLVTWLVGDELVELLSGPKKGLPHALRPLNGWDYLAPFGNLLSSWWLLRGRQHERLVSGVTNELHIESKAVALEDGIEDVEEVAYTLVGRIHLLPFIAKDHFPDFETFSGVPAVATIASAQWAEGVETVARIRGVTAKVEQGTLTLTVTVSVPASIPPVIDASSIFTSLVVAWVVDTMEPASYSSG